MASVSIPRQVAELVLLGPTYDRRQLQDSPILGDVWLAYAATPSKRLDLLIEPHWKRTAGQVAIELDDRLRQPQNVALVATTEFDQDSAADIAPLHGIVAARLNFPELLQHVVPLSSWWHQERIQREVGVLSGASSPYPAESNDPPGVIALRREERITRLVRMVFAYASGAQIVEEMLDADDRLRPFDRYLGLAALILWAATTNATSVGEVTEAGLRQQLAVILAFASGEALREQRLPTPSAAQPSPRDNDLVWQVSLNRLASPALTLSVASVKGDAARRLFSIDCSAITWAIVDSGINGRHDAFLDASGRESRVRSAFDFTGIREIVSLDNLRDVPARRARLSQLLHDDLLKKPTEKQALELLTELAQDARKRRPVNWELVRPFVEIKTETRPRMSDHGTHVAGIVGAGKTGAMAIHAAGNVPDLVEGLCPEINLMDFRVLGPDRKKTEFAIIAALQFIRFLNDQTDYMAVHGANLSLSIPHEVRNYACGKTPICLECERLVDSGVLVVAAAGNRGYHSFQTADGPFDGYAAFSVTDPGNADGVLTVGSTHRSAPHTYGVSFFSSRGPTGDGRPKPDIVAPGERIRAPFRDGLGDMDGTSMAAPHVSGAAAMLMARYAELIGQPRRVKEIICKSATDLGRERSFQGAGMLDVLRALQSI